MVIYRNLLAKVFYGRDEKNRVIPLLDLKVFTFTNKPISKRKWKKMEKVMEELERDSIKLFYDDEPSEFGFEILIVGKEIDEEIDEDELEINKKAIGVKFRLGKIYKQVTIFEMVDDEPVPRVLNEQDLILEKMFYEGDL